MTTATGRGATDTPPGRLRCECAAGFQAGTAKSNGISGSASFDKSLRNALLWLSISFATSGCGKDARRATANRLPDITGSITAIDTGEVWVEADPTDPVINGRGTPKARVAGFVERARGNTFRVGCTVRVWYDYSVPIVDTGPELVAAESVAVVRCPK